MDQWEREEIELGDEVRWALHQESSGHPELRQMRIRVRARHAQNHADINSTMDRVYGA